MRFQWMVILAGSLVVGCASRKAMDDGPVEGGLQHLGAHHFAITTGSPKAQEAFDRGLTLAYSFAHSAAEIEFKRAIAADPGCAMAYWGIALVRGPYINRPKVSSESAAVAWSALSEAAKREQGAGPLERDLIRALSKRYADSEPDERSSLDRAYAAEMRKVWKSYPRSSDAATLFAESAMDVHPWDYWKQTTPQPWTPEIVEALESALRLDPNHPGANHLYIHMMEGSPTPERALGAAKQLPSLVPDAGHMQHMPGHIYVRLGQWKQAAVANRMAMRADLLYRKVYPHFGYERSIAHNKHFCAYVAMMLGHEKEAIECARQLISEISRGAEGNRPQWVDSEMAIGLETLMRFGRWEAILKEPEPSEAFPVARSLWHFTRAVALTALGRISEANVERAALLEATRALPPRTAIGPNSAKRILELAALTLDGEVAARAKDFDTAIGKLRSAVREEDLLLKSEPPDWVQPVRHTLGAVLLRARRAAEAEKVYREDLEVNPENGWALLGLRDSLRRQGKLREAQSVAERLTAAWQEADVRPKATCFCQEENF